MVKQFLALCLLLTTALSFAQKKESFTRLGLLKADGTITPALMLDYPYTNIYLSGDLEYFVDPKVSFRSSVYWYLNSEQDFPVIRNKGMLHFGILYHFVKKRFDTCLGLQPGVSLTRPQMLDGFGKDYPFKALPEISAVAGITYYVWDFCNFFMNIKYVQCKYPGVVQIGSIPMNEVLISAGLGLQGHTLKKK